MLERLQSALKTVKESKRNYLLHFSFHVYQKKRKKEKEDGEGLVQCLSFRCVHELEVLNSALHSKVWSVRCVDCGSVKVRSTGSRVQDFR